MSNDSRVIRIVINSRRSFHAIHKFLLPNVDSLKSYGIPIEVIRKHVVRLPGCYVRNPQIFKDIMVKVENKLGISRDSPGFLNGIELLCRFSEETLESKCRLFRTFGWTQSDLDTFIVSTIICFTFSEAHIKKKFDFLMNEVQYKPAQLISCSSRFLICSLEKTMVPRHKVLLILKEKGLLKNNLSFHSAVRLSERRFLMRFVIPFKEVHQIYVKHTGCSLKMLTQQSAIGIS